VTVSRAAGSFLIGVVLALPARAAEPVLKLQAVAVGTTAVPLTIEVFRWSSDAERSPLMAALAPAPAPPAAPAAEAAGRGGRGGGGRGGRGGRGAAAPADPMARLTAAVKAAPTVGFVWGDGVTGYSIKYAWRSPQPGAVIGSSWSPIGGWGRIRRRGRRPRR